VPHELRHTAVAWWTADGADAKRLAQWAGHQSVKTTLDMYGHLFEAEDDAFMARLDAGMTAAQPPTDAAVVSLR
jgi:integrase